MAGGERSVTREDTLKSFTCEEVEERVRFSVVFSFYSDASRPSRCGAAQSFGIFLGLRKHLDGQILGYRGIHMLAKQPYISDRKKINAQP